MSAFQLPSSKERTKRSYIATAAFSTGFYSYDKTGTALNPVYTLNAGAAGTSGATVGNCTVGRILRENGRKLYPGGAYPGVTTLMVGVFFTDESGPANTFVTGYINPNSSFFAVFSTDKPVEVVDGTDAANSLVNRGPSVYTSGTVTAVGGVTMVGGVFNQYRRLTALTAGAATLTTTQLLGGVVTQAASGSQALTFPATSAIITALGSTVGASSEFIYSNSAAQAVTLTAGDGNTSFVGSVTVNAALARLTVLVTSATTVVIYRA